MKVIVPHWQGRVSPLFDAAGIALLVEIENNCEVRRTTHSLHSDDVLQRVSQTVGLGADILICGAISGPLERMLRATGLEVIPNICGSVDDVLSAYVRGALFDTQFFLPGCFSRRRRARGRHGR
jgi:predicted Fe-Mo cluster-binding NifX family protein